GAMKMVLSLLTLYCVSRNVRARIRIEGSRGATRNAKRVAQCQVERNLAPRVDLVVKVASQENPPHAHVAAKTLVRDLTVPHIAGKRLYQSSSFLSRLIQSCDQAQVVIPAADLHQSRPSLHWLKTGVLQFPEQPFVCIDKMLSEIAKAHQPRRGPPVFR